MTNKEYVIKRFKTHGKFIVISQKDIFFLDKPNFFKGKIILKVPQRKVMFYDQIIITNLFIYLRLKRLKKGKRLFIPIKDLKNNKLFGLFSKLGGKKDEKKHDKYPRKIKKSRYDYFFSKFDYYNLNSIRDRF